MLAETVVQDTHSAAPATRNSGPSLGAATNPMFRRGAEDRVKPSRMRPRVVLTSAIIIY
jgi:hypothetical protein